MLATIAMPDGTPLTIVPPEQIDAMAQQGLQSIEGVVVTPEECGAVFEAAAQMPEGTRYAVGAAMNPTNQSTTIITLTELDGAEELMRSQQGDAEARAETCSTYQVELQGETATGESTVLETTNDGAISMGARGALTLPTGQKQNTTTVSAARRSISVTAISQSVDSPAADIAILEGLVDQVLAAADQK
ncbi:hypothetical protein [Arthrobacter pityocampae]|uniref:hypothetical protein n=1 Tax=Arthrobacter pityocampae TaxID=547334 RepID=UPI003735E5EB